MPKSRKDKNRKPKDDLKADHRIDFKLIKMTSGSRAGNRNGLSPNGNRRGVNIKVQLLPKTRLLLALANEEVEARRKAGQSEAKIWRATARRRP
jgi:hypothetical protein